MNRLDGEGLTGVLEDKDTVRRTAGGYANDDMAPVAFDSIRSWANGGFRRFAKLKDEDIPRTGIGSFRHEAFEDAGSRMRR